MILTSEGIFNWYKMRKKDRHCSLHLKMFTSHLQKKVSEYSFFIPVRWYFHICKFVINDYYISFIDSNLEIKVPFLQAEFVLLLLLHKVIKMGELHR